MSDRGEIVCSTRFSKNFAKLALADRRRVHEAIRKLLENPRHRSLQAHQMQVTKDIWECYVTHRMRLIFETPPDRSLRLWDVGHHHIVDAATESQFSDTVTFAPWQPSLVPEADVEEAIPGFTPDPAWAQPPDESGDLPPLTESSLALLPATHLRFYGVPAALVPDVQSAVDIEQVAGLPVAVQQRLLDVLTNPDLENMLYDPDLLLYRTTLDSIEGFCEGRIKKLMLNLTPPQQQCVANTHSGMLVLRGTAGSGKTTVGIYRAIERAKQGRRVLLLTFTNSLVEALQSLVSEIEGDIPANLTILTVDSCLWQVTQRLAGHPLAMVKEEQVKTCMRDAIAQVPGAQGLRGRDGGQFLREEIETVILARGLTTWEAYRDAARTGRGSPLGHVQRRVVWDVSVAYEQLRQRAKCNDWHSVARTLLGHPTDIPPDQCYDDIIIDETQDVTLVKLRAVARLLRPTVATPDAAGATFWLLTDAAQTIFTSGVWWQESDLGPTIHRLYLRRNYRNTRQIAEIAAQLLAHNTERARDISPVQPQRTARNGPRPTIVTCATTEEQAQWVRTRLLELCDGSDLRFSDCAIVGRTNKLCERVAAALDGARIPHSERAALLENTVKVLTFHNAKGLEFPVVFVVGVDGDKIPNPAALRERDDEAKAREIERERALLYVALTRAADMLYVLTLADKPSPFLSELGAGVQQEATTPLSAP